MKKKLTTLLIVYYWPPSSGGGLMRWFKMSKYWESDEHELIIFTPDVKNPPGYDPSLEEQIPKNLKIIKTPIWEPHELYARFMGKKDKGIYSGFINDGKENWKSKLSVWVRSNFFIPDARKYWIKPSIKYLKNYLQENPVDLIISTGTPHSLHMIGLGLKKALNLPWIADFRDPWTDIDYADQLRLTRWAKNSHLRKEKAVLTTADQVVTVTWAWQKLLSDISGKDNVSVITNGYDPADFVGLEPKAPECFKVLHLGSLNFNRNPEAFWQALGELIQEDKDFSQDLEVKLIGQIDQKLIDNAASHGVTDHLKMEGFKPHRQGLMELMDSALLLLVVSQWDKSAGMVPGKTYEYLGSGQPILGIGAEKADVRKVLDSSPESGYFDYSDKDGIKAFVRARYQAYQAKHTLQANADIDQYSRKTLAGNYRKLVERLVD